MASESSFSGGAGEAFLNAELYADLIRAGGLSRAIAKAAEDAGVEVGRVVPSGASLRASCSTAVAATDRGKISVLLGVKERRFSISIDGETHVWAAGGTSDITSVARVIASWRTGVTLRLLASEFPFMEYDAMAQAYEDGDPVQAQWDKVLGSDQHPEMHAILRQAYSRPEIRRLYPYFSHGVLRFLTDCNDVTAVRVFVDHAAEGHYCVGTTIAGDTGEDIYSIQGVIDKMMDLISRLAK